MKIAVVVRSLAFGGMEKVAISLSEAFVKEGHESHLIYFNETANKLPAPKNVHLHSFELKKSMKQSYLGLGYIWKIISQLLNILIRNSYFVWSGLFMGYLFKKKLFNVEKEFGTFDLIIFRGQGTFEMIWPVHDTRFVFVNESLLYKNKYNFLQKVYAKLLFSKRNIVSISSGVEASFTNIQKSLNIPILKHARITNPIDSDATRLLATEPIEVPQNPYIVSAGRFHPIKNFPLLIEAYAYARKNLHLTLDLIILGEGQERKLIEETIQRLSLEKCVHLPGYIENPYPWIQHAELFVLTSKIEGLGMVLLESMVCGTDIVATDSPGGIKDFMTDELSSHICQADKIVLAKKIIEVLQNPIQDFSKFLVPYSNEKITQAFIQNFVTKKS
jgi:glycosyltransferase involved in cell wall biosynthesis